MERIKRMAKRKIYTISVVICTLNRPDDLIKTVHSALAQSSLPKEIIIVDAGDLGDLKIELESSIREKGIHFIYWQAKPSTTKQRNIGAKYATGDILFFLDDDIELAEDYFYEIIRIYVEKLDENIGGAIGVNIDLSSQPIQPILLKIYSKIFFLREVKKSGIARLKRSNFPVFVPYPKNVQTCEVMPAGAVSYSRHVFNQFMFDGSHEGYVMAEDVDLSYRVSRAYKLYITPYAKYVHHDSPISQKEVNERERRRIYFTQYFFKKNLSQKSINWIFRYWSLFGLFIFYLYSSIRNGRRELLSAFLSGMKAAKNKNLIFPH